MAKRAVPKAGLASARTASADLGASRQAVKGRTESACLGMSAVGQSRASRSGATPVVRAQAMEARTGRAPVSMLTRVGE